MDTSTMLSRSGKSNTGGKLTHRLDVPVPEELNDRAAVAAAKSGLPKAEFLRNLLDEALMNGCWFPLDEVATSALNVLSTLHGEPPGVYLASLVEAALKDKFSMHQMIARAHSNGEWDESTMKQMGSKT